MFNIVSLLGGGAIFLAAILLRLVDMRQQRQIGSGEFLLLTSVVGAAALVLAISAARGSVAAGFSVLAVLVLAYLGILQVGRQFTREMAKRELDKVVRRAIDLESAITKEPSSIHLRILLADTYAALALMDLALKEYQAADLLSPRSYEISQKRRKTEERRSRMLQEEVVFCAICQCPNPNRTRFCRGCGRALPQPGVLPPGVSGETPPPPPSATGSPPSATG